jgi:hypothetical protein
MGNKCPIQYPHRCGTLRFRRILVASLRPNLQHRHIILAQHREQSLRHLGPKERTKHFGGSQSCFEQFQNLIGQSHIGTEDLERHSLLAPSTRSGRRDAVFSDLDSISASDSSSKRTCEGRRPHTSFQVAVSQVPRLINVLGPRDSSPATPYWLVCQVLRTNHCSALPRSAPSPLSASSLPPPSSELSGSVRSRSGCAVENSAALRNVPSAVRSQLPRK